MCVPCSDVVKLTAQFVARNGAQFLDRLMSDQQVHTHTHSDQQVHTHTHSAAPLQGTVEDFVYRISWVISRTPLFETKTNNFRV